MATLNHIDRRKLSGSGIAEQHAKAFLDAVDGIIDEVNGRKQAILGPIVATGVNQNVAHGLGAIPTGVFPSVVESPDSNYGAGSEAFKIEIVSSGATNVVVKATANVKFYLLVTKTPT